jgi:hypothetical protein
MAVSIFGRMVDRDAVPPITNKAVDRDAFEYKARNHLVFSAN